MKRLKLLMVVGVFFGLVGTHVYGQGAGGFFAHSYSEKLKINQKRESSLKGVGGGGFGWVSESIAIGGELTAATINVDRTAESLEEEDAKKEVENKQNSVEFEYSGSVSIIGLTADYALIKSDTLHIALGSILGMLNYSLSRKTITKKDGKTDIDDRSLRQETEGVVVPTFITRFIVTRVFAIEAKYRHVPSRLEFKGGGNVSIGAYFGKW